MKKFFVIAVALLMCISAVSAQVVIGVKGGYVATKADIEMTVSGMSYSPDSKFGSGFEAGIFGEIAINDMFAIQPEVLFTRGVMMNFEFSPVDGYKITANSTANALVIPVLAKFTLQAGSGKVGLYLGPQFSFGVGKIKNYAKEEVTGVGTTEGTTEETYKDTGIAEVIFSGVAGVDYKLPLGSGALFIDARLMYDFQNISTETDFSLKRLQIIPSIGYGFSL